MEVLEASSGFSAESDFHPASEFQSVSVVRLGPNRLLLDGKTRRKAPGHPFAVQASFRKTNWPSQPREPTPFHAAVMRGDVRRMRALLEKQPDLAGAVDYSGCTPVAQAVWANNRAMIDLLLEHGADPNGTNAHGIPALALAIANLTEDQATALVSLLATKGADINRQAPDGGTALHMAARQGYRLAYRRLLELGAKPELKCRTGHTAADLLRQASSD
jgi:hypothetical protein